MTNTSVSLWHKSLGELPLNPNNFWPIEAMARRFVLGWESRAGRNVPWSSSQVEHGTGKRQIIPRLIPRAGLPGKRAGRKCKGNTAPSDFRDASATKVNLFRLRGRSLQPAPSDRGQGTRRTSPTADIVFFSSTKFPELDPSRQSKFYNVLPDGRSAGSAPGKDRRSRCAWCAATTPASEIPRLNGSFRRGPLLPHPTVVNLPHGRPAAGNAVGRIEGSCAPTSSNFYKPGKFMPEARPCRMDKCFGGRCHDPISLAGKHPRTWPNLIKRSR